MEFLFWAGISVIGWVYIGYPLTVWVLTRTRRSPDLVSRIAESDLPKVSVLVAAHNEQEVIEGKLQNTLEQSYPSDRIEVIVASDGSTDRTLAIARQFDDPRVRVLEFTENRGRALVHNDVVEAARGEILVFTDADTELDAGFLRNCASRFADPGVGCVVGTLNYRARGSTIASYQGLYWRYELGIRALEGQLGILATGTGACMALRKPLFRRLAGREDVDFTSPLDVVLQGFRVVHASDALAYDSPPASASSELRARIRMTSRNFIGTLHKWGLVNWFKHPAVSFGLLSHKVLRWLIPYFMLAALIANAWVVWKGTLYQIALGAQLMFYLAALLGWLAELSGRRIPPCWRTASSRPRQFTPTSIFNTPTPRSCHTLTSVST